MTFSSNTASGQHLDGWLFLNLPMAISLARTMKNDSSWRRPAWHLWGLFQNRTPSLGPSPLMICRSWSLGDGGWWATRQPTASKLWPTQKEEKEDGTGIAHQPHKSAETGKSRGRNLIFRTHWGNGEEGSFSDMPARLKSYWQNGVVTNIDFGIRGGLHLGDRKVQLTKLRNNKDFHSEVFLWFLIINDHSDIFFPSQYFLQ